MYYAKRVLILALFFVMIQHASGQSEMKERWKKEIADTEASFAQMVKEKGIKTAFLHFAAEGAVLKRGETLHIGKKAIATMYDQPPPPEMQLVWTPDFIDVSDSGDLGYTYGYYILKSPGPEGKEVEQKGVFHTVWKRQKDETWKYVWD